jgi:hypothetical protein
MADNFQPKFADLVRNYTSSVGTGDFVLGPAVSGYSSFSAALQVGDSFYYSTIGLDKPAEHEVGRGTLQANGTIRREPIGGTKTMFTGGTKTVALIAAAEWFAKVQANGPATRDALASSATANAAVLLSERGREGLFVFDPSNLGTRVAADPRQGVYVAPAADASGASGAWVRRFVGPVAPEWFGALGDGTSDDAAAVQAAIDYLVSVGGGSLMFAPRQYFLSSAIHWDSAPIELRGGGSGVQPTGGTTLRFPAGLAGAVNIRNGPLGLGAGSSVRALRLKGAGAAAVSDAAAVDGVGSGLLLQANGCRVQDLVVQGFEGNGVYLLTPADRTDVAINANNCTIDGLHSWENGKNGFATYGINSNHALIRGVDATNNGEFGVFENSGLGNFYISPHFAGNVVGPIRFGDIARNNRVIAAYKEVGTALLVQFDSGGAGQNHVEFQTAEGALGDPATFVIADNTAAKDNEVSVLGVRNRAAFGGDGANGTFVISEDVLLVRKGKQIQLQDEPLTANWFLGNYGGAAGFQHGNGSYLLMSAAGEALVNGTGLSVNGNHVVGPRQTGTPPDATDLASALTLVNALKAKLVAHGLIA